MLTIKNRLRNWSSSNPFNPFDSFNPCNPCNSSPPFNPFNLFNLFNASLLFLLFVASGCAPPGPKALIQGEKLIHKAKYTQAIEKLKLATTLIPTNAQAWNYLRLAYPHAGPIDEAQKNYPAPPPRPTTP